MVSKIIFSIMCIMSITLAALPEYVNMITDIQEIHGGTRYSLMLSCQHENPIITYAPATYEETMSDELYRAFMPNTRLADGVIDSSGAVQETGSGVEIILFGRLIEKIVADHTIMLVVEPPL